MSSAVICNNLVPSVCRSRFHLFVDVGEHHCQDTAADISVRSVEPATTEIRSYGRVRSPTIQFVKRKARSLQQITSLNHLAEQADLKIENNGQWPGPILQVQDYVDKRHSAARSWSLKRRFE